MPINPDATIRIENGIIIETDVIKDGIGPNDYGPDHVKDSQDHTPDPDEPLPIAE